MVKEKTNLKGSKKLQKDLNDPEEKSDLNDTQNNLNDDLNDLEDDKNVKNPKKDLNDLGEEEDDSEKDHNDLEDDSEDDDLEDVMEKSNLGFHPKKTKNSVRPVTSIYQQGQVSWVQNELEILKENFNKYKNTKDRETIQSCIDDLIKSIK